MKRLILMLVGLLAACGAPSNPDVQVADGWARATGPEQSTGAIYATIENRGGTADRLTGVATDRAAMAMIHEGRSENGIARMRMVEGVEIPAGGRIEFKPGGTHIMIDRLKSPLVAGEQFELRLKFDESGEKRVPVTVVAPGAR